jgi:hypothetical protein
MQISLIVDTYNSTRLGDDLEVTLKGNLEKIESIKKTIEEAVEEHNKTAATYERWVIK